MKRTFIRIDYLPRRVMMSKQATKRAPNPLARFPWSHTARASEYLIAPVVYENKVDGFIHNVDSVIKQRTNRYGGQDPVSRKLQRASTSMKSCLRRKNIVCDDLTRSLQQINKSLRGTSNVPKNVKANNQKLLRYLRDHVRGKVISFLNHFLKSLKSVGSDIRKLETQVQRQAKWAKTGSKQFKIDPATFRKLQATERHIAQFKTKWGKLLNKLSTYGNRSVQSSVNQIKREMDSIRKSIRHSISLIKSATKSPKRRKPGVRALTAVPKGEANALYNKWMRYEKAVTQFNAEIRQFTEQLKATKSI